MMCFFFQVMNPELNEISCRKALILVILTQSVCVCDCECVLSVN